jgi:ribose transport system permease protein
MTSLLASTEWRRRVRPVGAILQLAIPVALTAAVFGILNPAVLSPGNMRTVFSATAFVGLVAVGQTVVILTGEIDLSVGSVAALAAVVGAQLMVDHSVAPLLAVAAMFLIGAAAGALTGGFVVTFGMPSFVTSLAMFYIAIGLATFFSKGRPISPLPPSIGVLARSSPVLGLSAAFVVFLALVIVAEFALRRTAIGRYVLATGSNAEVAPLLGIRTKWVKVGAFVVSGVLASTAGLFQMASLNTATDQIGRGWELIAISAVVVGGTSIFGGRGSIIGTLFGMILIGLINNGLVLVGVQSNWQTLAIGVILIGAILIDHRRLKRSERRP